MLAAPWHSRPPLATADVNRHRTGRSAVKGSGGPAPGFAPARPAAYLQSMPDAREQTITWFWNGTEVALGVSRGGAGPRALLLPALSSISTRKEMAALQAALGARFATVATDWPGFGDRPRPFVDWRPAVMEGFLAFALRELCPEPEVIVAAGHGAGYVLRHAAQDPGCARSLVLIAPTWRGPLPTMMQGQRAWFASVRRFIDMPMIGPLLYRLNVSRPVMRHMAAGHVYADTSWLTEDHLRRKLAVTGAPGARHASVRFVTGALDPFASREEFLSAARAAALPMLVLYGAQTPPRSKAEIQALRGVDRVEVVELPKGKLSVHEEFPDAVAGAILAHV
jgi:pimeloyl-ACP methyl ester carboxylesterase